MKMVSLVIGSAEQVHIQQVYLRCFSLLPAAVAVATAVLPTVEAKAAPIGHRDSATLTPPSSASAAALLICTAATARLGTLSVAFRNSYLKDL